MEIKATCQMCGKTYIKKNGKSMFCSDACRKARVKQRYEAEKDERLAYQKKWREEHLDEAREKFKERHPNYGRDRSRKIRGSKEYTRECIVCGKAFTTWRPQKKTCSDECKAVHKKEKDKGREISQKRTPEEEHRRYIIRTYGSEEAHAAYLEKKQAQIAQTKAHRERERKERLAANIREGKCVVCGKAFTTYNPAQKKIQDCARGRHKTSGGYVWRYA